MDRKGIILQNISSRYCWNDVLEVGLRRAYSWLRRTARKDKMLYRKKSLLVAEASERANAASSQSKNSQILKEFSAFKYSREST